MNTTAGRMRFGRQILVPILILFILSLVPLHRQLLMAGLRMNSLIDGFENTLYEWTRIRTFIILGGGSGIIIPEDVRGDLEKIRGWLDVPELERLSRFSSLEVVLSGLESELMSVLADFSFPYTGFRPHFVFP